MVVVVLIRRLTGMREVLVLVPKLVVGMCRDRDERSGVFEVVDRMMCCTMWRMCVLSTICGGTFSLMLFAVETVEKG